MEFEELQQIWDSQNNQPLYAINEAALHNRILAKRRQSRHIANISELLLIIVNAGAGGLTLGIFRQDRNIFMWIMAAWMLGSALYVLISRIRRMKSNKNFDRSMRNDLSDAISVATYQVRLSRIMRWNMLPIGILILLGAWEGGKSAWVAGVILLSFGFAYYASSWEHRIYKARRRELEILKSKLESE